MSKYDCPDAIRLLCPALLGCFAVLRVAIMPLPSVGTLVDLLCSNQLVEPWQADELPQLQEHFAEPRALAGELIRRDWLTPYQANQLLLGHAQDLVLGQYVLLERLGEGGMGQVFKARHRLMGRLVALKVIRKERLARPRAISRFHREIRAAAQLAHPNVALAYDADQVGDTHFFVMEYVEGTDLNKLVAQRGPLPTAEACNCIRQAALGLQHAFERGLVHRDVKPANLLLASRDAVVKVLDLGLARFQEPSRREAAVTRIGTQGLGTLDFAAPEQIHNPSAADVRSDLYSLGCTFYYLLTGQVPFPGKPAEKVIGHQRSEPVPVEQRRPEVPPAVTAILRKLMAKRPKDRFQTPAELAAALTPLTAAGDGASAPQPALPRSSQGGEGTRRATAGVAGRNRPTETACEEPSTKSSVELSPLPQLRHRTRRGRQWLLSCGAGGLLLLGLTVTLGILFAGRRPPSDGDLLSPDSTVEAALRALSSKAEDPGADGDQLRKELLTFRASHPGTPQAAQAGGLLMKLSSPLDQLSGKSIPPAKRFSGQPPELVAVLGELRWHPRSAARWVVFSPDRNLVAGAGEDSAVYLCTAATLQQRAVLRGPTAKIHCLALAPNGKTLAAGGGDGMVRLWDVTVKKIRVTLRGHTGPVHSLAFAPDGKALASGGQDQTVRLWDAASGNEIARLGKHPAAVHALAFTPDSQTLASGDGSGAMKLWNVPAKKERATWQGAGGRHALAFAPDGKLLASGGEGNVVTLWDVAAGRLRATLEGHTDKILCLDFAPDGTTLASGSADTTVKLWDGPQGKVGATLRGGAGPVRAVAFALDGKTLAAAGDHPVVRLWESAALRQRDGLKGSGHRVHGLAFAPDAGRLAAAGEDGVLRLWDLATAEEQTLLGHSGAILAVAFAPDGGLLASGGADGTVRLWDSSSGRERANLRGSASPIDVLSFSPDGLTLALGSRDGAVTLWDVPAGRERATFRGHGGQVRYVTFTPDGQRLVSAGHDGQVIVWEPGAGTKLREWQLPISVLCGALAPDGRHLALGDGSGTISILRLTAPPRRGRT